MSVDVLDAGKKKWYNRSSVVLSLLIHAAIILVAITVVVAIRQPKEETVFIADPPPRPKLEPRKLEMKVKVRDLQKRSSRPKLQPRLMALAPTDVALPQIKKKKIKLDRKVKRNFSNLGLSGFGNGIGGGMGTGMGGGTGGSIFGSNAKLPGAWEGTVYTFDHIERMRVGKSKWFKSPGKKQMENKIYTYTIDIPYRAFSEGFPGLTDQFEWFAIDYQTDINFTDTMAGNYEFKIIVDDGAILQINGEDVLNMDGFVNHAHPPTQTVNYEIGPGNHTFRLAYFQGPREIIQMQLLYRKDGVGEFKPFDIKALRAEAAKSQLGI